MIKNRRRKNYTMKERISYHKGRKKIRGQRGAYSAGYVNGATIAVNKAKRYYNGNRGNKN